LVEILPLTFGEGDSLLNVTATFANSSSVLEISHVHCSKTFKYVCFPFWNILIRCGTVIQKMLIEGAKRKTTAIFLLWLQRHMNGDL